uniref:S-adenosyl-L-methionine-dependent methyltransferase n=1 Tax=Davidia involucrata TaxID=16924 RepID=A0A5B7CC18_DAVIN
MEWSQKSATNAYLDTLKLCSSKQRENCNSCKTAEPESKEFLSALAAGMSAKLIVEVTSEASPSTIALAAAARQTGGKLVCILPEPTLEESQQLIEDSGLNGMVEFKTGDPVELLPDYENIDFSLVDCKSENYTRLLKLLDVNPIRSVVVANNLVQGRKGLGGLVEGVENKVEVRSIGEGMEVTMIGKRAEFWKNRGVHLRTEKKGGSVKKKKKKKTHKSKWLVKVDDESGEEHFFRLPFGSFCTS